MNKSSFPYKAEGIASTIFPSSAITLEEVTVPAATSTTSPSAPNKVVNPSNSPALALTPDQMLFSVFSATNPET